MGQFEDMRVFICVVESVDIRRMAEGFFSDILVIYA